MINNKKVAVVIPCYKVKKHIVKLVQSIDDYVDFIIVVDDCCPENSGAFLRSKITRNNLVIIRNDVNRGVGGAVKVAYIKAIELQVDLIVKIDGDGQMNPDLIPQFLAPLLNNQADYSKGNRFFYIRNLKNMPIIRVFGNSVLSFINKISTGYWDLFDPTNGYTAIKSNVLSRLEIDKIENGYFFESDILFRLNTIRAVVYDIPIEAIYGEEQSGLNIRKIILPFTIFHIRNFLKRVFYNYYLRDMSIASIELPLGLFLFLFGITYGSYFWYKSLLTQIATPTGTIIISAITILIGIQFILAFLAFDISSNPNKTLRRDLTN
jgi:dolichol-phosphate mannosyltransferase